MTVRKIVQIDEEKCDGCGLCVPECHEGAIQIIDGKAKLVSDVYCDGLGACLGHCSSDAITITERDAEDFDERAAEAHAHGKDAAGHQCPSSQPQVVGAGLKPAPKINGDTNRVSALTNWPIQITLAPVNSPYFQNADLLVAADCVSYAYANFHELLSGKVLLIGCPKLDAADFYAKKLADILKQNDIKSLTVAHMEVPCCFGLEALVKKAIEGSGKNISYNKKVFGINGSQL